MALFPMCLWLIPHKVEYIIGYDPFAIFHCYCAENVLPAYWCAWGKTRISFMDPAQLMPIVSSWLYTGFFFGSLAIQLLLILP